MPVLSNDTLPGNSLSGSFASQVGQAAGSSALGSVGLSQASNRLNVAQMFNYSDRTSGPNPQVIYPNAQTDWRVRLSLAPNSDYFYKDANNSLLSPLISETGGGSSSGVGSAILGALNQATRGRVGVIFPYTPTITVNHVANYTAQKLTHSNYTNYFYDSSEVTAIAIQGEFTVQNINEGQYLMAAIHFFRSASKMFFGNDQGSTAAGTPPPILYLNGYGQYYLPNVPCVVTSFQHTMPADVDYMDIPEPAVTSRGYNPQFQNYRLNSTRMPTASTMTVTVQPVYSRLSQSQGFSLYDFARGALINAPGTNPAVTAFGASQSGIYTQGGNNGGFI